MKFFAKLQGVDLDKKIKEQETLFKDPKEYEDLSQEEKEKITQEMIKEHRKKIGQHGWGTDS